MSKANEHTFQNDMIRQLVANGCLLGNSKHGNRELIFLIGNALRTELSFQLNLISAGGAA